MKPQHKSALVTGVASAALVVLTAALINRMGVAVFDGIEAWNAALKAAAPYLLVWRLLLYGAIYQFWLKLYRLYRSRDQVDDLARIQRIGVMGLSICLFLELSRLSAA